MSNFFHRIARPLRRKVKARPKPDPIPPRVVILMTNPRSGSTWLFDMLRCHPAIVMRPTVDSFRFLGMDGRRYPQDLAAAANDTQRIEVRPREWDNLPNFQLPPEIFSEVADLPVWEIEKGHPQFFHFDVKGFVRRINALKILGCEVKIIYQVRDPLESMTSFLRYKKRNPEWFGHLPVNRVPTYHQRIFEGLYACAEAYPGLIVSYQELYNNPKNVLTDIYDYLWGESLITIPDVSDEVIALTKRLDGEAQPSTPFLGENTTQKVDITAYDALFKANKAQIEACYTAYHKLLAMKEAI